MSVFASFSRFRASRGISSSAWRGLLAVLGGSLTSVTLACEFGADEPPCPELAIEADLIGDLWRNASGGVRTGNAALDRFDVLGTVDGERSMGASGLTLHAHVQYTNGHEFSVRYLGDAQLVSNIESVPTWRMYELWVQQRLSTLDHYSLKAGLYDLNSEFDVIEPAKLFLNSSHGIGAELGQTGLNGPSIFPVTALGIRLRRETAALRWQVVALDGVPGRRHDPTSTGFDLSRRDGALLVAEALTTTSSRVTAALGVWRYTASFENIGAQSATAPPAHGRGNQGAYVSLTTPTFGSASQRATAWLRIGMAAAAFNQFDRYSGAGIVLRGLVGARPQDEWGLAVAIAHTGAPWRRAQQVDGAAPTAHELNIELTWRLPLTPWLTLQPDVQYLRYPGADLSRRHGLALGLRLELASGWSR